MLYLACFHNFFCSCFGMFASVPHHMASPRPTRHGHGRLRNWFQALDTIFWINQWRGCLLNPAVSICKWCFAQYVLCLFSWVDQRRSMAEGTSFRFIVGRIPLSFLLVFLVQNECNLLSYKIRFKHSPILDDIFLKNPKLNRGNTCTYITHMYVYMYCISSLHLPVILTYCRLKYEVWRV